MEIPPVILTALSVIIGTTLVGTVLVVLIRQYLMWKRYNIITYVIEHVAGDTLMLSRDMGGIYVDKKTNNKRFFLKQNDVGLNPDNIPYIINKKGQQVVYLLKTGLKNFRFLNFKHLKDQKFSIDVGEEDVNWALNAYERHKKVFGTTLLEKLLPYIGIALMGIFILGMIVMVFQKMDVLVDVAEAFERVALALAQQQSGTTVIQ